MGTVRKYSVSKESIRAAARAKEEWRRPHCVKCGVHVPPVGERDWDWRFKFGHRNAAGDPCDGEWTRSGEPGQHYKAAGNG